MPPTLHGSTVGRHSSAPAPGPVAKSSGSAGRQIRRFAGSITDCLTGDGKRLPWPEHDRGCDLSRASFPKDAVQAAKVFIGPLDDGFAEIRAANGSRLTLAWPAEPFPYAGIWITRGFWKGLHHWAIEPTNAPVDRLSEIAEPSARSQLQAREVRRWTLTLGFS